VKKVDRTRNEATVLLGALTVKVAFDDITSAD